MSVAPLGAAGHVDHSDRPLRRRADRTGAIAVSKALVSAESSERADLGDTRRRPLSKAAESRMSAFLQSARSGPLRADDYMTQAGADAWIHANAIAATRAGKG
jgi:hypothetical protein